MSSAHLTLFPDELPISAPVVIDPVKVQSVRWALQGPRKSRGVRHRISDLLAIMLCSAAAGAILSVEMAAWAADTARDQCADLCIGALNVTTLARVLQGMDADP